MYSLYRRHERKTENQPGCRFARNGVRSIKCSCPVWIYGEDAKGKMQRYSLRTRSWTMAQGRLLEIEGGGARPKPAVARPLADAVKAFLDDCRARKLAASTLVSYTNTLGHLTAFFPGRDLTDVNLDALTGFRSARLVTANTSGKEIQTMRAFFRFCLDRDWIPKNPAKPLKTPKSDLPPTMPFSDEEVERILAACEMIDNNNPREIARARLRARAMVLTMLYAGFRISDAIKLRRAALDTKTGQLLIRMMKTGAPLYVRLPQIALDALAALPVESQYFFWSGKSKLSCAVGSARRTIDCVLGHAGVLDGHPHRFRDTFSVGLLAGGADLRTVQLLLGHTSIKTTEKHYAPFVRSMQRALDQAVSVLHFGVSAPDPKPPMHAQQNALGDGESNLL
jgi:site-specific recombinase XerD